MVLKLLHASEAPGGLVNAQTFEPQLRVFDSGGSGAGPRTHIPNAFPGAAGAAGPGTKLRQSLPWGSGFLEKDTLVAPNVCSSCRR